MATWVDTFETGNLSNWTYSHGATVETDIVKNGTYALKCIASDGSTSPLRSYVSTPSSSYMMRVSFWMYIESWSRTHGTLELFGGGSRDHPNFYGRYAIPLGLTADRHLVAPRDATSTNAVGSTQLEIGRWYRISASYWTNPTQIGGYYMRKQFAVYIDGVQEIFMVYWNNTQFGLALNIGTYTPSWLDGESVIIRFDDIHYDDTDIITDIGDIP